PFSEAKGLRGDLAEEPTAHNSGFLPGEQALHPKWGLGTVVSVKGTGEEAQVTLAFPGMGLKTVMAGYARLEKAEKV
ncbi:MAG: DUF3553 domain-containing protein, partial [Firmicutes bacterium]|nr:DUF3553 domain-containing protein [Bacillota bacterium]